MLALSFVSLIHKSPLSLAPPQTKKHSEARPRVRLNGKQRRALMEWLDEYGGACAAPTAEYEAHRRLVQLAEELSQRARGGKDGDAGVVCAEEQRGCSKEGGDGGKEGGGAS